MSVRRHGASLGGAAGEPRGSLASCRRRRRACAADLERWATNSSASGVTMPRYSRRTGASTFALPTISAFMLEAIRTASRRNARPKCSCCVSQMPALSARGQTLRVRSLVHLREFFPKLPRTHELPGGTTHTGFGTRHHNTTVTARARSSLTLSAQVRMSEYAFLVFLRAPQTRISHSLCAALPPERFRAFAKRSGLRQALYRSCRLRLAAGVRRQLQAGARWHQRCTHRSCASPSCWTSWTTSGRQTRCQTTVSAAPSRELRPGRSPPRSAAARPPARPPADVPLPAGVMPPSEETDEQDSKANEGEKWMELGLSTVH